MNARGVVYALFSKYRFIMKYVIYRARQGIGCGVGDQGSIFGRRRRRCVCYDVLLVLKADHLFRVQNMCN